MNGLPKEWEVATAVWTSLWGAGSQGCWGKGKGFLQECGRSCPGREQRLSTPSAGAVTEEQGMIIWETDTQWKKKNFPEHAKRHWPNARTTPHAREWVSACRRPMPQDPPGVLTNPVSHPPSLHSDPFQEIRFHNSRCSVAAKPPQSTSSHAHCLGQATPLAAHPYQDQSTAYPCAVVLYHQKIVWPIYSWHFKTQ